MFVPVSRQRNGINYKKKIMRIAEIDVPKGCDKIFVELENGMLTVSYGSRTNKREVFNQYTKQLEELPGIGDFSIFWNSVARHMAVIGTLECKEEGRFKGNDRYLYENAIKFRDYEQYLKIRGIYAEKDEP